MASPVLEQSWHSDEYLFLHVQDDWKIKPRLTLNLEFTLLSCRWWVHPERTNGARYTSASNRRDPGRAPCKAWSFREIRNTPGRASGAHARSHLRPAFRLRLVILFGDVSGRTSIHGAYGIFFERFFINSDIIQNTVQPYRYTLSQTTMRARQFSESAVGPCRRSRWF